MNRRTLTMDFDSLAAEDDDDDDSFFDSSERISSVVPLDVASGSDLDEYFEDSRMSFVSAASIKRIYSIEPIANSSSTFASYDMWMAEPGDVKERRRRLLQGMGLSSNKDLLKIVSSKIGRAISTKPEPQPQPPEVSTAEADSSPTEEQSKGDEPASPSPSRPIVLVRSRSDGDIEALSRTSKQRKEELIGPASKQSLTGTSSGQLAPSIGASQYSRAFMGSPRREKIRASIPLNNASQPVSLNDELCSFFLIKNLDTGKDFIVREYNEKGTSNFSDVQTGKELTLEEFEKSVGYSPVVNELMRQRVPTNAATDDGKANQNSVLTKSFRNSKRKGAAFLKNIKGVATSVGGLLGDKEQENSSQVQQKVPKNTSQWVEASQQGKSYKELTALHMSQEIQAHKGSIWTIKFSSDARFLASAGEDTVIHVWEVQECDVMSASSGEEISSGHVHSSLDRPSLADITHMPSEMKKKGRENAKTGNSIPDYVKVPDTVLALSEKPVCTFKGHQDEVLDLSWSKSQLLLSSSMDKSVRMWDLETQSCLKMFAHNDYVTCVQFNPVDDNFFISGSLDAKIRIWNVRNRQVADWTDVREMVTAASYTPDGQGAIIGSLQGNCRMYNVDDCLLEHRLDILRKKSQAKKFPAFQTQAKKSSCQTGKVTGFQFAPWNPSEVLITSTGSRIEIYNDSEPIQKFKGFRNSSSQISASFSADGRHVISASEGSQVYIWKVDDTKNHGAGKRKSTVTVHAHEHFHCKDVSVAIAWPGPAKNEPPVVEIQSKRHHSKRSSVAPAPRSTCSTSPGREDALAGTSSRRDLPPLPKKKNANISCEDEDLGQSARIDPGIGPSEESSGSSSESIGYGDSPSISSSGTSASHSWSDNGGGNRGQTVQATAWGLAIVAASLEGEIRVYQNFGLPLKVSRPSYLF